MLSYTKTSSASEFRSRKNHVQRDNILLIKRCISLKILISKQTHSGDINFLNSEFCEKIYHEKSCIAFVHTVGKMELISLYFQLTDNYFIIDAECNVHLTLSSF